MTRKSFIKIALLLSCMPALLIAADTDMGDSSPLLPDFAPTPELSALIAVASAELGKEAVSAASFRVIAAPVVSASVAGVAKPRALQAVPAPVAAVIRTTALAKVVSSRQPTCPVDGCGKIFRWPSELKIHAFQHIYHEKCAYCEYCGKGFANPSNRSKHYKTKHNSDRHVVVASAAKRLKR